MTTLHFPAPGDWHLSPEILNQAMETIDSRFEICRDFHVPYLAGYSEDGERIYIDSRCPDGYIAKVGKHKGKFFQTDRFLQLHEAIEKIILMFFCLDGELPNGAYQLAHQIAMQPERSAVEAEGGDWTEYQSFMSSWAKSCEREGYENLPDDLDMTPYTDEDDHRMVKAEADD